MKWLYTVISVFFLLVAQAQAEDGESIAVFYSSTSPVNIDVALPSHITLKLYDLDLKDTSLKSLRMEVAKRVDHIYGQPGAKQKYSKAFSELMNSSDWKPIYDDMEGGARAIGEAVRLKIQKLPAVVINDKKVIYGVGSLKEAIKIYGIRG